MEVTVKLNAVSPRGADGKRGKEKRKTKEEETEQEAERFHGDQKSGKNTQMKNKRTPKRRENDNPNNKKTKL